ncbi:hypothetical protein [Candidatus Tisiphia endosymbiont of Beris chalybata]
MYREFEEDEGRRTAAYIDVHEERRQVLTTKFWTTKSPTQNH